jgi:hypothetical protein
MTTSYEGGAGKIVRAASREMQALQPKFRRRAFDDGAGRASAREDLENK